MKTEKSKLEKELLSHAIGQRLRKARIEKGYTQEQVAELLEMNTAYYGKVERGISGLTILNIKRISEILKLDIHYLITGEKGSDFNYEGLLKECPVEKRFDFEQLIKYALNLAKQQERED